MGKHKNKKSGKKDGQGDKASKLYEKPQEFLDSVNIKIDAQSMSV